MSRKAPGAIRRAELADVPEIVDVHMASFPGFFLTVLGRRFLELFYEEVRREEGGVLLVVEVDYRIAGFVAGVKQQAGFYGRLLERQKWSFALAATRAVLRNPGIATRLLRAFRKPKEARASIAACLMSVAVRPGNAKSGLGGQLITSFTEEMRRLGVPRYCLTTDRDGNEGVNAFYLRQGLTLSRSFRTYEGRWMNEYFMDIGENG